MRNLRGLLVSTALLAATLLGATAIRPSTAWAGDNEERANAIYKEAKSRFDNREFPKAVELATQAERIFPHPAITLLKGRALRAVGKLREAEEAYKAVREKLNQLPKPLLHTLTDELLAVSEEMRKKGELKVEVQPLEARLFVDGSDAENPFGRWLLPGKHTIEAGLPGKKPVVRDVELRAGDTTELKLDLRQKDGRLAIVVPGGLKGVEVRIDGRLVDIEEGVRAGDKVPTRTLEPGTHEVSCKRGVKQVGRAIEVPPDAEVAVRCEGLEGGMDAAGAGMKAVGWGGVAVGTGIMGYGLYGLGSYVSDLQDSRGIASTNKHWLGSTLTLVGAGTAAASYFLLLRDGGGATARNHAVPDDSRAPLLAAMPAGAESRP